MPYAQLLWVYRLRCSLWVHQLLCFTIILRYYSLIFYYSNSLQAPFTPSPNDSISEGEPMFLVIPFPTAGKPQKLLEKLLNHFLTLQLKEINQAWQP